MLIALHSLPSPPSVSVIIAGQAPATAGADGPTAEQLGPNPLRCTSSVDVHVDSALAADVSHASDSGRGSDEEDSAADQVFDELVDVPYEDDDERWYWSDHQLVYTDGEDERCWPVEVVKVVRLRAVNNAELRCTYLLTRPYYNKPWLLHAVANGRIKPEMRE